MSACELCGEPVKEARYRYCSRLCARRARVVPLAERFWAKVDRRGPDECWAWLGGRAGKDGAYGTCYHDGRHTTAHRVAYLLAGREIPDGWEVAHLCGNPGCCNPAHLEAARARENNMRSGSRCAALARKTHCKHGHPLAGENLYVTARGERQCRACRSRRSSDAASRRKAARAAARAA